MQGNTLKALEPFALTLQATHESELTLKIIIDKVTNQERPSDRQILYIYIYIIERGRKFKVREMEKKSEREGEKKSDREKL